MIRDISKALHDTKKVLIVVIPPALANLKPSQKQKPVFDKDDFDGIKDLVDAFSLMTYDYASHNGAIAPNAPIEWVEENVKYLTDSPKYREKILLGLNFYGMKYALDNQSIQPEPVVGSTLIDLLKSKDVSVKLDDKSDEHMFIFEFDSSRVLIFSSFIPHCTRSSSDSTLPSAWERASPSGSLVRASTTSPTSSSHLIKQRTQPNQAIYFDKQSLQ